MKDPIEFGRRHIASKPNSPLLFYSNVNSILTFKQKLAQQIKIFVFRYTFAIMLPLSPPPQKKKILFLPGLDVREHLTPLPHDNEPLYYHSL